MRHSLSIERVIHCPERSGCMWRHRTDTPPRPVSSRSNWCHIHPPHNPTPLGKKTNLGFERSFNPYGDPMRLSVMCPVYRATRSPDRKARTAPSSTPIRASALHRTTTPVFSLAQTGHRGWITVAAPHPSHGATRRGSERPGSVNTGHTKAIVTHCEEWIILSFIPQ